MDATNDNASKALLPTGMRDTLPPHAGFEAHVMDQIMTGFAAHGYDRIKPPLLEFEENLLRGPGEAMASQTFRLMDPVSQRMMGLRADITPQVARIATTRLAKAPRPLRLSYAGEVLRIKGTQLRADRQFGQVGVELIGANTPVADAEIILMAADIMNDLGIDTLSVDLCLPTLVSAVCRDIGLASDMVSVVLSALDRKDAAMITELSEMIGSEASTIISALLAATGPADDSLTALKDLKLGENSRAELKTLEAVVEVLRAEAPGLVLTVDVVENRGWEYHTGVTFTFFTRGVRGELGAGGRYETPVSENSGVAATREQATGLTLFMDTLLRALPEAAQALRLYVPAATPHRRRHELRKEGWMVVPALQDDASALDEAVRLNCSHQLVNNEPQAL